MKLLIIFSSLVFAQINKHNFTQSCDPLKIKEFLETSPKKFNKQGTPLISVYYLLSSCPKEQKLAVMEEFLRNNYDPITKNKKGIILAHNAAIREDLGTLKLLAKYNISFHQKDPLGNTALLMAAYTNNPVIFQFLLEQDINVDDRNNFQDTLLHYTANSKKFNLTKMLIEKGANPSLKNKMGMTPLMLSIRNKDPITSRYLIDVAHAYINNHSKKGMTALFYAIKTEQTYLAKYLVSKGAELGRSFGPFGKSAYTMAQKYNNHALMNFFKQKMGNKVYPFCN